MVLMCQAQYLMMTLMTGTSADLIQYWIWLIKNTMLTSKVLIHHICTLACGRQHLHGIQKTWICTVLTLFTLVHQRHGRYCITYMSSFKVLLLVYCFDKTHIKKKFIAHICARNYLEATKMGISGFKLATSMYVLSILDDYHLIHAISHKQNYTFTRETQDKLFL